MELEDVLAPMPVATFVNEYLGQRYFRTAGIPRRFDDLLSWERLDHTLDQLRATGDRVRLVGGGRDLPATAYLCQSGQPGGSQLRSDAVTARLREGATLLVAKIDELVPAIRQLTESFERLLLMPVRVNAYAGFGHLHGFDLHWDHHDTLIIQVSGRKHWRVYEPTRLHPLAGDEIRPTRPGGHPIWDGLLEAGDVLYMPRGWWHMATPVDEPSLHLTVSLTARTAVDVLDWIAGNLRHHVEIRKDIPHLAGALERREYIARIRELVVEALGDTVLEDFVTWMETETPSRPRFRLRSLGAPPPVTMSGETRLRLAGNRRLRLNNGETGDICFSTAGKSWMCGRALRPALAMLSAVEERRFEELVSVVTPGVVPELKMLLLALVAAGGLSCEEEIKHDREQSRVTSMM